MLDVGGFYVLIRLLWVTCCAAQQLPPQPPLVAHQSGNKWPWRHMFALPSFPDDDCQVNEMILGCFSLPLSLVSRKTLE